MYHTPPPKMVNTRSQSRKNEMDGKPEHKQAFSEPTGGYRKDDKRILPNLYQTRVIEGTSMKHETAQPPASVTSKQSTSSSVLARRKQLELEAAREKARIQMELIDKKLEADLAELEDENYSSHLEKRTCTDVEVEKWLDRSQAELEQAHSAPDRAVTMAEVCPPPLANDAGTSDGTIQMLAAALKEMAASANRTKSDSDTNLLSRICTPKELPIFAGDPMDWLLFKQAYDESTQVCKFTPKENLWRLRKCLRGPAKEAIASLLITATEPDKIMSTLELRFGNPDTILSRIMQDIKKIQPMSQDYQKDIVLFSVKIQNFVAAVQAVGHDEYLQGMNLVSILLSKIPTVLISKWSDYSFPLISQGNKKSRMEILSDFLKEEAVKISTTANSCTVGPRVDFQKYKQHDGGLLRTQTVLVQQTEHSDKCHFCRVSQHKLTDCKKFKKSLNKVRWQYVKRSGLCFKCLLARHDRQSCTAPLCDKDNCGQAHHKLLHYVTGHNNASIEHRARAQEPALPSSAPPPPPPAAPSSPSPEPSSSEVITHISGSETEYKVLLKVVPIRVHGPNCVINSSALLDDGSTVTLISSRLAERAGLRGRRETMHVRGAWLDNKLVCDTTVMTVNLSGKDNKIYSVRARSVSELNLPVQNLSVVNLSNYANLFNLKDKVCNFDKRPEILIGQDNYHLLYPIEIQLGNKYEPSATLTPLGWCLHGSVRVPQRVQQTAGRHSATFEHATLAMTNLGSSDLDHLHEEVKRYFSLDAMGVSGKCRENVDDVRAVAQLEQSAKLVDGRWQVGLPWKEDSCTMPDSFPNALKRLKGVERKMARDCGYAERYEERVNHLFQNDYSKELVDTNVTPKTWYLSHFGVDNPNKKKLRLVFDAADKADGKCLNDYLLKGPDLLSSLLGIMLRFREHKIAVTGDIKDMFLRVKIRPEDQDALRFLWRNSQSPSEPVKTFVMTSLIFGANCSPFIAQFIKNKNAQRFQSSMPDAVDAIHNSHYVDDYIQSLPDEEAAIKMVKNIAYIYRAGGFEMCNWTSNSVAVLHNIPNDVLGTAAVRFKIDQQFEGERTLGLIWYPAEDELGFDLSLRKIPGSIIQRKERPTKRLMLRIIMSIFDVFGFLAPFTIQGRIILQDTWRSNIGWDDVIPDDIYKKWCEWIDLLKVINHIRIPRCYSSTGASETEREIKYNNCSASRRQTAFAACPAPPPPPATTRPVTRSYEATRPVSATAHYDNAQLHIFCDASTKAMCAVAYWRWIYNGTIHIAFIASKCRVLPVKPLTVPQAELQAALLGARLADAIANEHKIKAVRRYFWCDSTTVIQWIKNNTRAYKIFVANRLGEIDELTQSHEWRYVPTNLNVADLATRDTFDVVLFNREWLNGPGFLYDDEQSWPVDLIFAKKCEVSTECVAVLNSEAGEAPAGLPVPDANRFSSFLRLQRATAVLLKSIKRFKRLTVKVDCALMEHAERLLLMQAQADSFPLDIAAIKKGKPLPPTSKLLTLSPYLDEHGILRVGGRIDAASEIGPEVKRPIILNGQHPTARLLVRRYHIVAAHGNHETVVNEVKQRYWLLRLRPTVKYVVHRCMSCKLKRSKPLVPRMGDLPAARMAHHQRPFTHCGLDLFGPMEVAIGRQRAKRYGVLFTCLTVRAVHIEIVSSLSSDSLIMALRRMAARRGWPSHLYSDNGTNLRGSDTELRKSIKEIDFQPLENVAANNAVQWAFIPPASPHWGGAWERLIRSVKSSLRVILKERAPREEVLITLLADVENIVNSRPLMHVSVDPGDPETLTPNHFLLGGSSNLPTLGKFDESDFYLKKLWRKSQRLADMYWQRWVKEILPELRPRRKWNEEQKPLQVGDLVLIVDPNGPRNLWQKGRIERVYPGKDGRVRVVDVKTKADTLRRSVARVAPVSLVD